MTIWITRETSSSAVMSWADRPHMCADGEWRADTGPVSCVSSSNARLILGNQWQPGGMFCFEVEIGEVKRVRTRGDVIAGLRAALNAFELSGCIAQAINEAIALIEDSDSSDKGNRE